MGFNVIVIGIVIVIVIVVVDTARAANSCN
jgi:hypothetical protein